MLLIIRWFRDMKRYHWLIITIIVVFTLFWFSVPTPLFTDPTCTVLTGRRGELLAATIASDGQYRFPMADSVPEKLSKCIVAFEDRHFYRHPGVNPLSIGRALLQNLKKGRVVSGGSTITMQVVRLSRKGRARTVFEKLVEVVKALRLEIGHSKEEILRLYASNAPFGGNVVGIDAAAWRYFGRSANSLSWAEAAALAVLPNSPSIIFPGRNQEAFLRKRNRLLRRLCSTGVIDSLTLSLAVQEPLPGEPKPLPQLAPHLLGRAISEGLNGVAVKTTIDADLQERVTDIVNYHRGNLEANSIRNIAVLVVEVETGNALAYVGNTTPDGRENGNYVDIITSPRSTGSILKPFLYGAMLNDGLILPHTLIPDIPTQIGGFTPKNYNPTFDGAVPASRALARSLNVPAVRMLNSYTVGRFHEMLNRLGLTTINRSPGNYGLSLILGGAEATLWDLAGVYSGMARTLNHYRPFQSQYNRYDYHAPRYVMSRKTRDTLLVEHSMLSAAAIYFTFEAMREVARPDELAGWRYFASTRSVAWKTGTSFGHRDAWAIGLNPGHVVAVWVGNASGEGRAGLTGVSAAAPILFDVFGLLPPSGWFSMPYDDMAKVPVCRRSGQRATSTCEPVDSVWVPQSGLETPPCPYHRLIHLDASGRYRVNDQCYPLERMLHRQWFVLPPAIEWFYRNHNPDYNVLPPFAGGCTPDSPQRPMALLYPRIANATITIPYNLDGTLGEAVFEVAHRNPNATIFWHLDEQYLGETKTFHKMTLCPRAGIHTLTLVDMDGEILVTRFRVEGRLNR